MNVRRKNLLGFPYPAEYEAEFNRGLMKTMHKPLLTAVVATLMFVTWLVGLCVFAPEKMGPAQYVRGLLVIHFAFMLFTLVVLMVVIIFRRQLFLYPATHVALCNIYAIGVCVWSSVLSAYAHNSVAVYIAFIMVTLCVSMVSLFKPWLAVVVFSSNYALYLVLLLTFLPRPANENVTQLYSGALAAVLGMVIAIAFYRFRTRTFYDRLVIARQMDEINQINHQLQQLVHIDNLTGLFNRRFYDEKLAGKLEEMARGGGIACAMLDIDFFKRYNDHYGHPAGDGCLRAVAGLIGGLAQQAQGVVVRYGGEEFLLLARADTAGQAEELAWSLCRAVEGAYLPNAASPLGKVTVSCGMVYCHAGAGCVLGSLVEKADEALYQSKQAGRNRATLYQEGDLAGL